MNFHFSHFLFVLVLVHFEAEFGTLRKAELHCIDFCLSVFFFIQEVDVRFLFGAA